MKEKLIRLLKQKNFYFLVAAVLIIIISIIFIAEPAYKKVDFSEYKLQSSEPLTQQESSPVNFDELWSVNKDVCGWIYIPGSEEAYGSAIDYPILQSAEDMPEDFYLGADLHGKKSKNGSIYIQRYNSKYFTDKNTIIYGHNLSNRQMFTPLHKYLNRDFFDKNEYIYIYLPDKTLKYRVYSAFVHTDKHVLYEFDFSKESDYFKFLGQCVSPQSKKGLFRKEMTVTNNDRLITLSTCTNKEKERLLVVGVLIEETENAQ